jgi:hypothetical protein
LSASGRVIFTEQQISPPLQTSNAGLSRGMAIDAPLTRQQQRCCRSTAALSVRRSGIVYHHPAQGM